MPKITWDKIGERFFEAGVDHGVLYPQGSQGVPWNGLLNVTERTTGGEPMPYYIDGIKYANESSNTEFEATIEAYTYPEEFEAIDGTIYSPTGLASTGQPRQSFGLSYRTLIGNDIEDTDFGYKIHLIYNALASPVDRPYKSLGDDTEPLTFSWSITTTPVIIPQRKPTAHLIIDSRKTDSKILTDLKNMLYGTAVTNPRMPTGKEVASMFSDWEEFKINAATNGLANLTISNDSDLKGNQYNGLYDVTLSTKLMDTSIPGIKTLKQF